MKRYILIIFLILNSYFGAISNNLLAYYSSDIVFHFTKTLQSQSDLSERAVAFHSITFIDSAAHSLGQITFGTAEANSLQRNGWYENETYPDIGSIQWSGGPAKQATIRLMIPEGTEGLLLKIYGIEDSLRMTVIVDTDTTAVLRVDNYWHSGYVPIGNATPVSLPDSEPKWIDGQYFPHFPETDCIYVFPAPTFLETGQATFPDWRIDRHYREMMALTLVGMQGVINRRKPCIYLDFENNLSDASRFWISYLEEYIEVIEMDLDYQSAIHFILRYYGTYFTGAVLYDPVVPETINLATMIAGLENRLILAPEQLNLPCIPSSISINDLRDLTQTQGWDDTQNSKVPVYQWAYDNLWDKLEKRIIGVVSPGPPVSGEYATDRFNPFGLAIREFTIALKLPVIFLDGGDSLQGKLYGKFLSEAPSPIPVTGVSPYETTTMPLVSQHGDWNACLSYPGDPTTGNLSVYSAVRPEPKRYKSTINKERILSTLGTKPVAMMFCSDGDNLSMQIHRGFHGGPDWVWEKVQGIRYGWTINPTLSNLAPVIWDFYMDSKDQVEFVCGLSGAGATLPDYMNAGQLQEYVSNTSIYLEQTGISTVFINLDKVNFWTDEMAAIYYQTLSDVGYLGAIGGKGVGNGLNISYAGVPAPACGISYTLEATQIDSIVDLIVSRNTDKIIYDFSTYPVNHGIVIQDIDAANGEAVQFSGASTDFHEIMNNDPFISLAPGDYTATFRLKVSDNQSSQDFIVISIGRMKYKGTQVVNDGWEEFVRKEISPDDFQQTDSYQFIQIPFSLDILKTDIEVITSHRPSVAQFTADYFSIDKNEPDHFPVFAALIIPLLSADRMTDVPRTFADKFEKAGGILLTPDEFMAALNPEYMINFATPIIGAGDPRLAEAKTLLDDGKYFSSLLAIRNALKEETSIETVNIQPIDFELYQNYPNPFNPTTTIKFELPKSTIVSLKIYNLLGQMVRSLIDEKQMAGSYSVLWDGKDDNGKLVTNGIYMYRIQTQNIVKTKKMVFLK